tara:strand:+ start:191 stop:622 length:432 start_codon:yes stop_codon:yes gene_type:complete
LYIGRLEANLLYLMLDPSAPKPIAQLPVQMCVGRYPSGGIRHRGKSVTFYNAFSQLCFTSSKMIIQKRHQTASDEEVTAVQKLSSDNCADFILHLVQKYLLQACVNYIEGQGSLDEENDNFTSLVDQHYLEYIEVSPNIVLPV